MAYPTTFEELIDAIDNVKTQDELDDLRESAVKIARWEGSSDPVEQAECWLNESPISAL